MRRHPLGLLLCGAALLATAHADQADTWVARMWEAPNHREREKACKDLEAWLIRENPPPVVRQRILTLCRERARRQEPPSEFGGDMPHLSLAMLLEAREGAVTLLKDGDGAPYWGILVKDEKHHPAEPADLPEAFRKEGLRIRFRAYVPSASKHDYLRGIPIRIVEIDGKRPVRIDLQEGFDGAEVRLSLGGAPCYEGKPRTNPLLGVAGHVEVQTEGNTPALRVRIPDRKLDETVEIDLGKGAFIGLSVAQGKVQVRQQDRSYLYD